MSKKPNQPIISGWNTKVSESKLTVHWNTWGGTKAVQSQLIINNEVVATEIPSERLDGQDGQFGMFDFDITESQFVVHVILANAQGESKSESFPFGDAVIIEPEVDIKNKPGVESYDYYFERLEEFRTSDWYEHFVGTGDSNPGMKALAYYVRVNGADKVNLNNITETENQANPDNVNRVIRLMPKSSFIQTFPIADESKSDHNEVFSYLNFLKAVAVVPGYAGDFSDFPEALKTPEMANPDAVAKKFLATTLGHAVQETSNTGKASDPGNFKDKVPGTFREVGETGTGTDWEPNGIMFGVGAPWHLIAKGSFYYGRGAKQLSTVQNYSNQSMALFGDLRLVAYPSLIETNSCLGFLTALLFTLMPQHGAPSNAEIMDGTWHKLLNDKSNTTDKTIVKTYDREFPVTVVLVNGLEGEGQTSSLVHANSKVRIDAYNDFITGKEFQLLKKLSDDSVDISQGYDSVLTLNHKKLETALDSDTYQQRFNRAIYFDTSNNKMVTWNSDIQIFGGSATLAALKSQ